MVTVGTGTEEAQHDGEEDEAVEQAEEDHQEKDLEQGDDGCRLLLGDLLFDTLFVCVFASVQV